MAIHIIDTNVVLRFLLADHEQHFERAAKLMSEVQAGKRKAYLPESVLAECIFILTKFYKVPREEAAARLGELLDYKGFTGSHLPILKEALAIFAAEKSTSWTRPSSPSRVTMAGIWRHSTRRSRSLWGKTGLLSCMSRCNCANMKNITVTLDDETYRKARIRAAELDTSVSAVVRKSPDRICGGQVTV